MSVSTGRIAVAAGATLAMALVAMWQYGNYAGPPGFEKCRTGQVAGGAAAIGGPFELMDENGQEVTDKEVLAKPALVYFGYTYCPDVCPTDSARNAEAVDILEEQGYEVTPVFISVDPRRDTSEVLKDWTDLLHPRMIGLTGTEEQIRLAARAYKSYYQVPENPVDDNYLVDHSTQTFLMLPNIGFVEYFGRDITADAVAEVSGCFLDAAPPN
ncbi:MAG: SCO family protein [Paracoccaceae bacterium]